MKLLLHICCGPCAIYPVSELQNKGIDFCGYFYNPNIHPFREFKLRVEAVKQFATITKTSITVDEEYKLTEYLRKVAFHEQQRCPICYAMRLETTAEHAVKNGYDTFSTTLLYSKYQDHEQIRTLGNSIARKYHIDFYYQDFRNGWKKGRDLANKMNLYRQAYCGCIYSEQERYDKTYKKKQNVYQKI